MNSKYPIFSFFVFLINPALLFLTGHYKLFHLVLDKGILVDMLVVDNTEEGNTAGGNMELDNTVAGSNKDIVLAELPRRIVL